MKKLQILCTLLILQFCGCGNPQIQTKEAVSLFTPDNSHIQYTGRIDFSNPDKPRISGAGAYILVHFRGTTCDILLEDQKSDDSHSYIAIVLDGEYKGRIKLSEDITEYQIADNLNNTTHTIMVCKATESQNGYIDFMGIICSELLPVRNRPKRRIEFIGDSITCGMGLDISDLSCNAWNARWYDQHNAFLAYGPQAAKELDADWLLSSVSRIGLLRNSDSAGPTISQVYDNTYLDTETSSLFDAQNYIADLVSICLGTGDFSDGDGSFEREPLDSSRFIIEYIRFVKKIRDRYPDAQICCLTSPMLTGEKSAQLEKYLSKIIQHMKEVEEDTKVQMFVFSDSYTSGCSGHPNGKEHQKIAEELLPFYKNIMGW
ncbi:SGNH/GDSL hydrolase family protein [Planctomycetota bacterium]